MRTSPGAGRVLGGITTSRQALVLVTVLLSSLLFPLTITGASLALPGVEADLSPGPNALSWVVNGYNACFAAFLAVTGVLADALGRRRVFGCGVGLFLLAGIGCAVAGDVVALIAARALSGLGAAAATTGGSSLLAATLPPAVRARAFGLLGAVLGAGLAFGPAAGGLLVAGFGWRAVFAVPAALAAAALLLVPLLPTAPGEPERRIDWPGAGLFTAALLLLIFGLNESATLGTAGAALIGVVLVGTCAAFVVVERRSAEPLFELGLLRNRRFAAFALAAGTFMGVLVPLLVYLPSYLVTSLGFAPVRAGLWLLVLTAPTVFLPFAGSMLARRVPPGVLVAAAVAVTGAGAALVVTTGPGVAGSALVAALLCVGIGVGLSNGVLDGLAIGSVRSEQAGTASGLFNTVRLTAEAVALAGAGAVVSAAGGVLGVEFAGALHLVCAALAAMTAISAVAVLVLSRR
ncbi:MFS transporter [Saccharopolyspora sp. NFXS83]|uniref:MFS transporter n=1 Tax=Saccharopolyspora sp. NFXS83 TaxID=2993560 RepID=UPI00224AD9D3|nr:MFS transporter [Saccharopolyspora sp. NFXS83]MCX2729584.1 MFS transporter [Saccharopolyspora sp. NFXS83]